MNFGEVKDRFLPFVLPAIFFLLPWQTRWIFSQQLIAGDTFAYGVLSLYAVEGLILIALLLYGRLKISANYQKIIGFTFLFFLYVSLTCLFAINHTVAFGQLIHIFFALVLFLLLLDERTNLRKVGLGFVLGLLVPICLGWWQVIFGGSWSSTILGLASREAQTLGDAVLTLGDGTRILRAYGSFSHPNIFGGYLAVGLLSFFFLPLDRNGEVVSKLFWYILFILFFITLIATFSQSAWIALVVGLVCGFSFIFLNRYFNNATRLYRFLPWLAGIFSVLVLVGSIFGVLMLNFSGINKTSISERAEQYQEWSRVSFGSLVLGSGLGNYTYALEELFPKRQWWEYQPVHNILLLVVGEVGVAGLIILISWFLTIDKHNFSRLPKRFAVTAMAMGCALLVVAGLDHYLWTQWSGLALCAYAMAMTVRVR